MKRQRAKQRPLYRYDVYRGRRRGQARLIGAAGCAVFGLLLVLIRSLGIRFSGFLLLGLAALLVLSWLLDRLAAGNHRWRLIHRGFYGCLTVGLAALLGLEVFIINRGRSDMTPLPADAVIVLGAGVNGTEPSLSLRTRLDKAVDYLERWPDIPAVLTGGTGYGEEISEAQCMYDYLTEYGVEADRLILEDRASNTAENFAFSWELLTEAGVLIDAVALDATLDAKRVASCRMVRRAIGDGSTAQAFPLGATQGGVSALGYAQNWTLSGGSTGELYLSKVEKRLLGVGNRIGSYSPVEGMVDADV